ncbi:MAG: PRC-barrel domain-containing protein [Alphaproteobacteria bacterium]
MSDTASITSGTLIAADKVNGTTVYNLAGEKLGSVDDIMIDKVSGRAIYAVMSFGGFLGMGEKFHPLPWSTLKYDSAKSGYVINMDKKVLENAPAHDSDGKFAWTRDYGRTVDSYYGTPSYWM